MKKILLLLLTASLLFACKDSSDNEKANKKTEYPLDENLSPSGEKMTASDREAKLEMLITESKRTVDSINIAYNTIRRESRISKLSMDERNQVSEALLDLSNARDLIILDMQQSVINELNHKTQALQTVMQDMSVKSQQMLNIATTLSRVSGIIEKTTTLLSSALSIGLVRPKINVADTPS